MTDTDDDAGHAHGHEEHGDSGHDHGHDEREPDHDHDHGHDDHDHSHDHHATDLETVGYAVVTVSSSRRLAEDTAGDAIVAAVESADDEVVVRELVADEFDGVQSRVAGLADRADIDCVVTTGGTGVTPDDVTVEAVRDLFDTELPGFGELFRELSRDEIGTRVIATRATAGIVGSVPVFCLPGSENAARLGAEELVTAEAAHLAGLARRE
ncbi:molybdenum cofactor biosynthesis protein B [Halobaculum sp. MBLA0147]|uniref:MogA/MoaB family molybdenum cofactor biosynthesis protein n=1 Tax=Halobaculum sp. MBLA0147 TaxID=3079934 RepID=UPI0035232190